MKQIVISILKSLGLHTTFKVPASISSKYTKISDDKLVDLKKSLLTLFFKTSEFEVEKEDYETQLFGRLNLFRERHIPFLVETISLNNKRVLEIGCGTGSSTVALAEQGAIVTGIDIDADSIAVAQTRTDLYGVKADFIQMNALDIKEKLDDKWDIIIFFASLEHMTPTERFSSLKSAYDILKPGGSLCVFGTPNRLWYFDIHTSLMPFNFWLQDEIAIAYSKFSEREHFKDLYKYKGDDLNTQLYRWGVGVSYHELEIALDIPVSKLNVLGSVHIYLRRMSFIQKMFYKRTEEYKFKEILKKVGPKNLHPAFYENYFDVIIKK
jgi:2-polyprenyl-3-methyl-5-hydroxy-6-metoxy-1,4-benzoquinol methylase